MLNFIYCESIGGADAIQTWNLASSLIFLALAALVWNKAPHRTHRYGLVLIALASIAWHSTESQWALALDIGAIAGWSLMYAFDLSRARKTTAQRLLLATALALVASALTGWLLARSLPLWSGAFIPYAAAMLTAACIQSCPRSLRAVCALSGAAMALATVMREIDLTVCVLVPTGTHWLWHLLAGLSLAAPIRIANYCWVEKAGKSVR